MEAKELRDLSADDLAQKLVSTARRNRPPKTQTRHQPFGKSDVAQSDQAGFGAG